MHLAEYDNRPSLEENQGTVTEEDAAFLYGLALAVRPNLIAEVGTGWFRSLRAFTEAASWMDRHLGWPCEVWSCDIDQGICTNAEEEFPSAFIVNGDSAWLAEKLPTKADLLFIDGEHSYDAVNKDYDNLLPVMSERAVIVFHDTSVNEEVKKAAIRRGAMILPAPRGIGLLARGRHV